MQESEQIQGTVTVTVTDDAGVLMEEEADWLHSIASELSGKTGWSVSAVTCDGEPQLYVTAENGILCLVNVNDGTVSFTADGKAEDYFDSGRIEEIIKEAEEPITEQDYTQSLYLMLLRAGEAYEAGEVRHGSVNLWIWAVAAAVLCAAVGGFWVWRRR